jgi:hypothetical protein
MLSIAHAKNHMAMALLSDIRIQAKIKESLLS